MSSRGLLFTCDEWVDVQAVVALTGDDSFMGLAPSRAAVWPALCTVIADWHRERARTRGEFLRGDRMQWNKHAAAYREDLLGTLLRLRFARETWGRDTFAEIAANLGVCTAVDLQKKIGYTLGADTAEHCSTIYVGISLRVKRRYYGLVLDRNPMLRFEEHWKAIKQHHQRSEPITEWKYTYMAAHDSAENWIFLPLICCDMVLPRHRLRGLERRVINNHPSSLNMENRHRHRDASSSSGGTRPVIRPRSAQPNPVKYTPIVPKVRYLLDKEVVNSCDIIDAFTAEARAFSIHSSYPWSTTMVQRIYGESEFEALSSDGDHIVGRIRDIGKLVCRGSPMWWHIQILNRVKHVMLRPLDYEYLLALCKKDVPRDEARELYVEDYWRMFGISRRELQTKSPRLHKANTDWIVKRLRERGITVRPDKTLVVRLPRSSGIDTRQVRTALASSLRKTYLPLCVCDHILKDLSIVWEGKEKLGQSMDNGRRWAKKIVMGEEIECGCSGFPDLPHRHGHVFCPSWEYSGKFASTIRACMSSHVLNELRPGEVLSALRVFWLRYLPEWSLPDFFSVELKKVIRETPLQRAYSPATVQATKKFLSPLAVTAIDKAAQGLLLWCPKLYEEKYCAAFSEEVDPAHFSREFEDMDTCQECMESEYNASSWKQLGGWNAKGEIPMHYILPKYKDIICSCEEVYAKKGTCCRVRPILPYTNHPLRLAFKIGGSFLWLALAIHTYISHIESAVPTLRQTPNPTQLAMTHYTIN